MRRTLAAIAVGLLVAVGGAVAAATPAEATCTILTCPPKPDKDCGITGKLCKIGRPIGPHRASTGMTGTSTRR